ncbi:hypothetical protein Goshw_007632 [Gossypium schwendimanii]|uniref:Photosystem II cytochrome b559 N-terminal domain-containing protein n=2 Tax=Gossypium schwendimanii TaxID=34291 RepID=A0A7J9L1H1_GOSSC|nr:hypothetical protein [Gossypium schwendimanii]
MCSLDPTTNREAKMQYGCDQCDSLGIDGARSEGSFHWVLFGILGWVYGGQHFRRINSSRGYCMAEGDELSFCEFPFTDPIFYGIDLVQEYVELGMSGSTRKCSFADIIASIRYWVIHSITIPSLFIMGWLFVSKGLAYDVFESPRPNDCLRVGYNSLGQFRSKMTFYFFVYPIDV